MRCNNKWQISHAEFAQNKQIHIRIFLYVHLYACAEYDNLAAYITGDGA